MLAGAELLWVAFVLNATVLGEVVGLIKFLVLAVTFLIVFLTVAAIYYRLSAAKPRDMVNVDVEAGKVFKFSARSETRRPQDKPE